MTVPAIEKNGSRWYPIGDDLFMSVTAGIGMVGDPLGLMMWSAGLAAKEALNELPRLIRATRLRECGRSYNRCQHEKKVRCERCPCNECPTCVVRWMSNRHFDESSRRANEGKRAHDVFEHWALHDGEILPHDDDIKPFVAAFLSWVSDYGITPADWEMAEATVVNRTQGYAGTLDVILTLYADRTEKARAAVAKILRLPKADASDRAVIIVDYKSKEKEATARKEYALQEAAYKHAETVVLRDGTEVPMPKTDGAAILQVRSDGGYDFDPVLADEDTFNVFLAVLTAADWYLNGDATAAVSRRTFKAARPEPTKRDLVKAGLEPAEPKARARKAPAKKAAAAPAAGGAYRSGDPFAALAKAEKAPHPDSPYQDDIPF